MKAFVFLTALLVARASWAASAADINSAALATRNKRNLRDEGDKVILYGQQTNGPDTRNGKWACAKVVSIVLKQAGVPMKVERGVSGVERSLKGWRRITAKSELAPGDVVVWTSLFKGNANRACTGGGTCHVGIYTSDGYFHNDPLGHRPTFGGIGLLGFRFKVAFRPR
jgi:hypothetical protein